MIYCTHCGAANSADANYCEKCGKPLRSEKTILPTQSSSPKITHQDDHAEQTLWEGRPSDLGDQIRTGLLMNNVRYKITSQRLIITTGLMNKKTEEIELVRIKDISMEKTMMDRMMGVGTITVVSTDPTTPEVLLEDVKEVEMVKDLLRDAVRVEKERYNTRYREDL